MKKILGLTVSALMVMGLVGSGTWAFFSDTETIGSNVLLAGTLDLGLDESSGQNPTGGLTGTFSASDWAPGDTIDSTVYVNNEGSMAMTSVNLTITHEAVADGTPGTISPLLGGSTDNLDEMIIATTATWNGSSIASMAGQSLSALNSLGSVELGSLPADTEVPLHIVWTFSTTATNGCQGDSVNMTMTFLGKQQ
jgi:predicted ribosomally synthesized peptide with SipW-like signal peptide